MTRLGVFGGAFDPPHIAHVALASAAAAQLGLDELRIFPTGQAWHKARGLTPAAHRLAMARIAFGGLPRTVIDDRELKRSGPTYTVDTLAELRAEHPGAELFLLMGEDQALAFTRWHDWQRILQLATLCVAARPDVRPEGAARLPDEARTVDLALPPMPESATDVRQRLARGEDVSQLVPPGVASYIDSHHLYPPA